MELVEYKCINVAREVLRLVATHPGGRLAVEGFVNGREQGYHLTDHRHAVSFSRDRSSDSIVVQFGKISDFSMQGNVLRSAGNHLSAWREYYATPELAAEHIAVFFKMRPSSLMPSAPITVETQAIRMDLVQALNELAPYVSAEDTELSFATRLKFMQDRAHEDLGDGPP